MTSLYVSARNSPGSPSPRVLGESAKTTVGPGRQRQIGVAHALGTALWNPLGEPQPAHSLVTQTHIHRISGTTLERGEEEAEMNSHRGTSDGL